jgi:hypothetical protein
MPPINMPANHADIRLKCKDCKWMYQGFGGKTCQVTRQVEPETRACIEFQIYRPSPYSLVEQDKWVKEMEKSIQTFSEEYLEKQEAELDTYKMYKDFNPKEPRSYMSEETMLLLSHRFEVNQNLMERIIEIKSEMKKKFAQLLSLQKDTNAYLFTQYTEQLRALKNESERSNFYRNATPRLSRCLDEIEHVIDKANEFYLLFKDTHFSMKQTQDGALEIWKSRIQSIDSSNRSKT